MEEPIEINGAPHKAYRSLGKVYDYLDEKTRIVCPSCKGLGFVWKGWFSCDEMWTGCGVIALIETGEVFEPLPAPNENQLEELNASTTEEL